MWTKAAPGREAQGELAYMQNYMTWWIFMVWIRASPGREAQGILTYMPIYMARFVSKVIWPHNNRPHLHWNHLMTFYIIFSFSSKNKSREM